MENELNKHVFSDLYCIPEQEMDGYFEFPYDNIPSRYYGGYSCNCGRCLNCLGLSEKDFM
jgi:hypothetical protein